MTTKTKEELIDELGEVDTRISEVSDILRRQWALRAGLVAELDELGVPSPEAPEDPQGPAQPPETPHLDDLFAPVQVDDPDQPGPPMDSAFPTSDLPPYPGTGYKIKLLDRDRKDPMEQQELGPYLAVLINPDWLADAPSVTPWLLYAPEGLESHLMWKLDGDEHRGEGICGRRGPYGSWSPPAEPWPSTIPLCVNCVTRALPNRTELVDAIYREVRSLFGQQV